MRIAISNIAWDVSEDEQVAALIGKYGIDAIDVAPGKYFADPINASSDDIVRVRDWWGNRGIEITGMQALLFGTTGLNLFGSHDSRTRMLEHLEAVCRIGKGLGATRLVFGSPRNRDRLELSNEEAQDVAVLFFGLLGSIANRYGVVICLEPNPPCYGANFMTNSVDTASIVVAVAHPSIRMQLDTGALTINKEDSDYVIEKYAELIAHVHASEPDLVTLGSGEANHPEIGKKLREFLPDLVVTIEMLSAKVEDNMDAIEMALQTVIRNYRTNTAGEWGNVL